jgi:hypothetical protein
MMPSLISGRPSIAVSSASLMWQARAISMPPPRQNPLMAAMTGLSAFMNKLVSSWPVMRESAPSRAVEKSFSSVMSAPAIKALPLPENTITLTPVSDSACSRVPLISERRDQLSAFIGGLLISMRATPASFTVYVHLVAHLPPSFNDPPLHILVPGPIAAPVTVESFHRHGCPSST